MFNKFVNWFILSSKNPGEVGMTVKSTLLAIIPVVSIMLGLAHVNLGDADLTIVVDSIVGFLQGLLAIIASIGVVWGFVRKVWASFTGSHVSANIYNAKE